MKREGVSTIFIRSYLQALSYLLDHFEKMLCLKYVSSGFLKVFWKRLCFDKLYNDSRLYNNVYKVLSFWKYFIFGKCFESVLKVYVIVFENSKDFYFEIEQATRSNIPTQKYLFISSFHLILLSYHWFGK